MDSASSLRDVVVHALRFLLLTTPEHFWWSSSLWLFRSILGLVALSLILRTYIVPWILARLSPHLRVRSISLRSIRGLYLRAGAHTLRADRISYIWSSADGSRRLTFHLNGLALELGRRSEPKEQPSRTTLTFADFAPSPIAHRTWTLFSSIYSFLDPYLRPVFRTYFGACLRLLIRWVPDISQALALDLHSPIITFTDIPGAKIVANTVHVNSVLAFTQTDKHDEGAQLLKPPSLQQASYSVTAWRRRLTHSMQRSWDRAWGTTHCSATVKIKFHGLVGSAEDSSKTMLGKTVNFFALPGAIDLEASLGFSPRRGSVDPHSVNLSLTMGDAYVELHAMLALIQSLKSSSKPEQSRPSELLQTPPAPYFGDSLQFPALLSPTSPNMSFFSSPTSPNSPRSPFLSAFSASISRRQHLPPLLKLKDVKDTTPLVFLARASIRISKITATARGEPGDEGETHKIVVHAISADTRMSSPECDPLHLRWLGRTRSLGHLDPDGHVLNFSTGEIKVDRTTPLSQIRLLAMESTDFQALAIQWPVPWLRSSPFLGGDPNTPLFAIHVKLGAINVTERVDCLTRVFAHFPHSPKSPLDSTPVTLPHEYPVPRLAVEVDCGVLCGRLIVGTRSFEPSALELRSDGFIVSVISHYSVPPKPASSKLVEHTNHLPLHLNAQVAIVLMPTFLRVCSKRSEPDQSFIEPPLLFSMEALELTGRAKAIATICDDDHIALVDLPSMVLQLQCATDALCVELWHPFVLENIGQVLSALPPPATKPPPNPSSSFVDRLPSGLFLTVSLARFVLFITAPDINPDDTMEISRGFAARSTGLSMQYGSLLAHHQLRMGDVLWRSQTRQKMYLSEETILSAVFAVLEKETDPAVASLHPPPPRSVFLGITLPDLAFRSAVATQYDADDPLIAERDDPNLKAQEFLRLSQIRVFTCLSGGTLGHNVGIADNCEVSMTIPYVEVGGSTSTPGVGGRFDLLAHIYSILLAAAFLKQLAESRPPRPVRVSSISDRPCLLNFSTTVKAVQILCALQKQSMILRFDAVTMEVSSKKASVVKWNKALSLVRILPTSQTCQDETPEARWEEFACLQKWTLTFPLTSELLSLDAETARVRIPYGFVLADLILDVSVTVKAVRHLARISASKRYYAMPTPEAEGPKSVPRMTIRISSFCAEAADDPFESRLGMIWRRGFEAAEIRNDRENAFAAKVASILAEESFTSGRGDYQFGPKHSISIEEARQRLNEVHSLDWCQRLDAAKQTQLTQELNFTRKFHDVKFSTSVPNLVHATPIPLIPPLLRVVLTNLVLNLSPPSFPLSHLPDFLYEQGNGLPKDTQFSLLVPLHLNLGLASLDVTLRDYPLPLISIPASQDSTVLVLEFDTDLVIAEEMGTDLSVDWVDCPVVTLDCGLSGAAPFSLSVPKTIMPVKSYSDAAINVSNEAATIFTWGVSYGPTIQDLMRVVETLSSAPRDPSPGMGFWDKMRLIFHWRIRANFTGEVRYQMKGLRDPYEVGGAGAGFVLAWQGNPELLIAQKNTDNELIQVTSESMLIAIPDFSSLIPTTRRKYRKADPENPRPFEKICAQLRSGVRFGIGFVMERSCGPECPDCHGSPFHRKCRLFDFRPHYDVKLQKKPHIPIRKSSEDSFNGFRSDFIHLSTSLTSAITPKYGAQLDSSSFYLTPKVFTHFWSWWALFDNALSLPIRQGPAWPVRPVSPKFGRHLATLKYRISVQNLYISHAYIDETRETWDDGVTPWIGVKGLIEDFQVDMHQREEETTILGLLPDTTKIVRRKPFYAVELVIKGLDLRTMLATFEEPLKKLAQVNSPPQRSNYRTRTNLPPTPSDSTWNDADDFIEIDWAPPSTPSLHFLPIVACPRFTYFKRAAPPRPQDDCSKFGSEASHICLLGTEPSVPEVQIALAMARVTELKEAIKKRKGSTDKIDMDAEIQTMEKMVVLLQDYIDLMQETGAGSRPADNGNDHSYHIPSDTLSEAEWAEFDNVYQIHCPKIFLDSAIRDIMMQYYYCSRARRGVEYYMAARAVKFIRSQAEDAMTSPSTSQDKRKSLSTAQTAAHALLKILSGHEKKSLDGGPTHEAPITMDPLDGWFEGVSLQKGHCCLLLKPQIVLRDENASDQIWVVAAVQAKLQSYAIMDDSNVDDPVSGKVMSRTYTTLSGLQTFTPVSIDYSGDGCLPLEVLIDFRCESNEFDRLVPQTAATFHYDKFNRLRLRNNVTSALRSVPEKAGVVTHDHLHDQTDLVKINIPQFTVIANDRGFQTISNIVGKLLLFSDAAHKTRVDKLETLLFTYDFNDLASVADVVLDLQGRLRSALRTEETADVRHLTESDAKAELLKLQAHKMLLAEELSGLFDCIKLAQDQRENKSEPKSALLLHTSSSEISWRMLDDQKEMLAKLVVQNIDFYWLSRQDSSTVNNLTVGNLQAFDGAQDAQWAEILSKYDEPANHPLLKRGVFVLANWTILAPVGGITIYESFELNFHPMRLQIDAKIGRRLMEYVWPARRNRNMITENDTNINVDAAVVSTRSSLDSPRALQHPKQPAPALAPPIKLSASRSFTDLRSTDSLHPPSGRGLHRTLSSGALNQPSASAPDVSQVSRKKTRSDSANKIAQLQKKVDAAEMKTRSSQKSFVLVRISSLNVLLSIMKEESFVCRDAHIRTRDLEYRNQTSSFEELVNQFIPSDMSWKGWLKMAFHQPLVPVLPVARELISKTKWIANKNVGHGDVIPQPPKMSRTKALTNDHDSNGSDMERAHSPSPHRAWRRRRRPETPPTTVLGTPLSTEPEEERSRPPSRNRMFSLFERRPKTPSHNSSGSSDPNLNTSM